MKITRYAYSKQFGIDHDILFEDLRRMILNGDYVLTKEVTVFLNNFSNFIQAGFACGTNSGTDALILAMKVLNIGPGDEVITQANTFNATVAAIKFVGATPVLVDADENTFLMNVAQIEENISSRCKAIIPVHLYGKPSPMEQITELASKHNIYIIEDCAQAHGSKLNGKNVGTFGKIGCYSFHPSKNLAAAGDGGCIVTNDAELFEKCQQVSSLGQKGQNNHVVMGFNSKLDALQARILDWKLPFLSGWNIARNQIADRYYKQLSQLPIKFQQRASNEFHTYHLLTIRTEKRNELQEFLKVKNIDTIVRYPTPIHLQKAFEKEGWKKNQFPVAEKLANELLCLPIRPDMSTDEIDYVCDNVKHFF
ncbi:DegT/DnrJ/EryC1/StrS family aminotransferase [Daejeonella oryzae]|uniref:DegT/DnrJ/EryC1/StrS family aminotransferase n=1 Tax=Daejeonella oryzae TaxID=1122943 RepID=UPI00047B3696|nr:DegT/DnrJ/EryC1/StrS family aminotransferase [Daejeonella oryzae]